MSTAEDKYNGEKTTERMQVRECKKTVESRQLREHSRKKTAERTQLIKHDREKTIDIRLATEDS